MPITEIRRADGSVDFKRTAEAYQKEHQCRWAEACLEIKRRYPEAQEFFGLPPAEPPAK